MIDAVRSVYVADPLKAYLVDLAITSRRHPAVELGLSPRATLQLAAAARAHAAARGRAFATPDDVKSMAVAVLSHRLMLRADHGARLGPDDAVGEILADVAVPRADERASPGTPPAEGRDPGAHGRPARVGSSLCVRSRTGVAGAHLRRAELYFLAAALGRRRRRRLRSRLAAPAPGRRCAAGSGPRCSPPATSAASTLVVPTARRAPFRLRPSFELVEAVGADRTARMAVSPIRGGRQRSAGYRVPTERRGVLHIGPLVAVRHDLLGLARSIEPGRRHRRDPRRPAGVRAGDARARRRDPRTPPARPVGAPRPGRVPQPARVRARRRAPHRSTGGRRPARTS